MQQYNQQNPDEVWEFMDSGDRVFLQEDMMDVAGGIACVETTLWDGKAQLAHHDARTQGDFINQLKSKMLMVRHYFSLKFLAKMESRSAEMQEE